MKKIQGFENKIICGDILRNLRKIPDESVDCIVTSPPYYGLRDYGVEKQIGLEKTPAEYIKKLVEIFKEVRRVLKKTGTVWLNLGDSYANNFGTCNPGKSAKVSFKQQRSNNKVPVGFKSKDIMGIPWRVAIALQEDGWYLRQDIIWAKPNPMPESVTDRCTKAHEYIFLLTKQPKYYFNAQIIKKPAKYGLTGEDKRLFGIIRDREYGYDSKEAVLRKRDKRAGKGRIAYGGKRNGETGRGQQSFVSIPEMRNERSVWTITTKPYKGAHFAVFPPEIPETCIKAGCPEDGIVLDPFLGSGTTAMVAKKLGRRYIGIELNSEYIKLAKQRIDSVQIGSLFGGLHEDKRTRHGAEMRQSTLL